MKKFFTLMAAAVMAISASAESNTVSFGAATISGIEKDNDVPCVCFTVPATYFPGGTSKVKVYGSDKGMKVRTNKGADANDFSITVNEGCKITKLVMGMVANDANSSFVLSGISVDGTPVADFTAVTLPNTANADGSAIVNLENIEATQNITFFYNYDEYTGKNKQVFIAGDATYEEISTAVSEINADNAQVVYFNLQGVRVDNPQNGCYIKRCGDKAEKVYVK